MAQTLSNIQALLKERYRYYPKLLQENEQKFNSKVKSKNVELAGNRTLRMPKKLKSGGDFRTFSPDGGDMGLGSGAVYDVAYMTPIYWSVAVQWNWQVETETTSKQLSVENAFETHLADAYDQYSVQVDKMYQTAGDAVLLTQSAGAGTTAITAAAGAGFGTRLLYPNQIYDVYDSTLATLRADGPYRVISVNNEAGTFVINTAVTGNANTDVWVTAGMSGANPTGLYGIPYHDSGATSGTWLNLSRATYPQLRTPFVTASAPLALGQMRLLMNKMRMFRTDCFSTGSWAWYMSEAQEDAYQALHQAIMNYDMSRRGEFDLIAEPRGINGIQIIVSSNANPTRVELVDFENWGRGETVELKLYDVDEMTTFPLYASSGGLAASQIFYLVSAFQTFVDDPGRAGYIASLDKPTGYNY